MDFKKEFGNKVGMITPELEAADFLKKNIGE
jgi:hypothetical protein